MRTIHTTISEISGLIQSLADDLEYLEKSYNLIELEIKDIYHHIELSLDLSASNGFMIYKQLKSTLKRRRKIINDKSKIQAVLSTLNMKGVEDRNQKLGYLESGVEIIGNEENKFYKTNILISQFGDKIIKEVANNRKRISMERTSR